MESFNLTAWSLRHRAFIGLVMIVLLMGGIFAYQHLGQHEDPDFTFRTMLVKTLYPGASALEVENLVTEKLERTLQQLPNLNYLTSYSKPGESVIFVTLREDVPRTEVANLWYQVRKKAADIQYTLPQGILGPFFNDEFGDTYSAIFAFSGDGFSYAELKTYADRVQKQLLQTKDVEKADLIGIQEEKIFIEFNDQKLAGLNLNPFQVARELQAQNLKMPAGSIATPSGNFVIRLSGQLDSEAAIRSVLLTINNRTVRIGDIATVRRGYVDPPKSKMRFNGKEVIGLGLTMNKHGDIQEFGNSLATALAEIETELPVGIEIDTVSNQARAVQNAIGEFRNTFLEALVSVLFVSFLSLGVRAGSVVALTVPMILSATLLCMWLLGIDVHRVSLGAMILSLGLLVDDAMIAIEMMSRKLDEGWDKIKAAGYAYQATAFPMLTGTLISVTGFLPVGLARSQAGEYTEAIFQVVAISMLISWFGAVIFTPYLGFLLLKSPQQKTETGHDLFNTPFYNRLRYVLVVALHHRYKIIAGTLVLFGLGILAMTQVPQQFFPTSNRPEIIVDLWLPEGSSFEETGIAAKNLESILAKDQDVESYVTYIGNGSPRFFLLITQQLANTNLAELVITAKDIPARERILDRLHALFATQFPEFRGRAMRLNVGPPVEYPIVIRVRGPNPKTVRDLANQVTGIVSSNHNTIDVNDDWHERIPVIRLEVDQEKAKHMGIGNDHLAQFLQAYYSGVVIGQYRENEELIDLIWRSEGKQRQSIESLKQIALRDGTGQTITLSQLAKMQIAFEDGIRWRRDRLPTISVRADLIDGVQAPDVTGEIMEKLEPIKNSLPVGYSIETGSATEDNWTAQKSILTWIPLVVILTLLLLMLQLQNFSRTILVFATAPLGIIGAALFLLLFDKPFGFVALLGIIALAGMIMRNSVILIDQIEQDEKHGLDTWNAIIESTVRRFRPIMLTATAAILAMIPLSFNDFFGPQAIVIMGGLTLATILTILFLPALYAAWFKVATPLS